MGSTTFRHSIRLTRVAVGTSGLTSQCTREKAITVARNGAPCELFLSNRGGSMGDGTAATPPASGTATVHDPMDGAPAGHAAPGPEADAPPLPAPTLQLADAVHQVERVEQGWRHRHGAVDAAAAFLEALEQRRLIVALQRWVFNLRRQQLSRMNPRFFGDRGMKY
jgi:hypothetical protein